MSIQQPIALQLAEKLAEINSETISANAIKLAVMGLIDTIGVSLAGAREPAVNLLCKSMFEHNPSGPALLLGSNWRGGLLDAALINGTAAHALDYDDMAEAMGGHPSVPVVPVVLALAEANRASGMEMLEAYIIGFEAECRLGRVVHPHHYMPGWHPTSTLGVFGAAAAASRLLRLDPKQTATALAIAASGASGIKANFGTMTKPLHSGHAARNGLHAAMLARQGYTANLSALEHQQGFFSAYDGLGNVQPERLLDHWGERLEIEQEAVGLKQFPCCGSTHPAILAMLDLVARTPVDPSKVEQIRITTYKQRLPHTNNPNPQSALGGKFSIQYVTARALLESSVKLRHFENDAHLEADVRRLMACTEVTAYADRGGQTSQGGFAADVFIRTRSGEEFHGQMADGRLGRGPLNPMSEAEMWEKFSDCAGRVLNDNQAGRAFEQLNRLVEISDVHELVRCMEVDSVG